MSGDDLMFDEFITLCDEQYEYGLIEFKNGDVVNKPGENDGSAKVLSYAALAEFDKDTTLKVRLFWIGALQLRFRARILHADCPFSPFVSHTDSFGASTTETSSPPPTAPITRTFATS